MKEYIDKAVLIAMCKGIAACEWNKKAAPVSWADAYERFADEVEDFDAADVVERKRGEWELYGNDDDISASYFCSLCGWNEDEDSFLDHWSRMNFCPNCGADMREVEHENQ